MREILRLHTTLADQSLRELGLFGVMRVTIDRHHDFSLGAAFFVEGGE